MDHRWLNPAEVISAEKGNAVAAAAYRRLTGGGAARVTDTADGRSVYVPNHAPTRGRLAQVQYVHDGSQAGGNDYAFTPPHLQMRYQAAGPGDNSLLSAPASPDGWWANANYMPYIPQLTYDTAFGTSPTWEAEPWFYAFPSTAFKGELGCPTSGGVGASPTYSHGSGTSARNKLSDYVRAADWVHVYPWGGFVWFDPAGCQRWPSHRGFPAKLTHISSGRYSWVEQIPNDTGSAWTDGRTGNYCYTLDLNELVDDADDNKAWLVWSGRYATANDPTTERVYHAFYPLEACA